MNTGSAELELWAQGPSNALLAAISGECDDFRDAARSNARHVAIALRSSSEVVARRHADLDGRLAATVESLSRFGGPIALPGARPPVPPVASARRPAPVAEPAPRRPAPVADPVPRRPAPVAEPVPRRPAEPVPSPAVQAAVSTPPASAPQPGPARFDPVDHAALGGRPEPFVEAVTAAPDRRLSVLAQAAITMVAVFIVCFVALTVVG